MAICEPWDFKVKAPAEVLTSKELFSAWRLSPSADHLVYTATEATNADIRASKQNPIRKLHGLIVDFDAKITKETCDTILDRAGSDFRPTWLTRTFSGGARLIWMFESPVAMEQTHLTKEFLKVAMRELRLLKLFPGFDQPAFMDLTKLYDVGQDWKKLGDHALAANVVNYWLTEAAKKTRWDNIGEIIIPIDKIAEEVEKQFPGRWEGPFEIGKRGVVFFDSQATNDTSAIVTEAGMVCFSTDQNFYPWARIFGTSFVKQFQADKIGAAVNNTWWDGKYYYLKSSYGVWEPHLKEDFAARLKVKHGIDATKHHGEVASELDMSLVYVQEHRRVTGVLPKLYDKDEIIYSNGRRFLNNAAVVPLPPHDNQQDWGVSFPWLADFFDTCFDKIAVPCVTPGKPAMPAKDIFLGWWKRLYCSALAAHLLKGQAMFLVGPVGRGKTLLATIIGRSLGGSADASDFLNHSTSFNKELLETALWCIDDGIAAQDPQGHLKFTEMVKRAVANPYFSYHAKYHDSMRVEWHGRVLAACNEDSSSVRIIPNLDASIEDKIIILLFSEFKRQFPDWHEMDNIITTELPCLLRWMVDWEMPGSLTGDKRFGINSYIDESVRIKSLHAGGVSDLLELMELWIKTGGQVLFDAHSGQWRGTATAWMAAINAEDTLRPMMSKYSGRQLGRKFVEAARIRGSRISIESNDSHGNTYLINLDPIDAPKKTVKCEPGLLA